MAAADRRVAAAVAAPPAAPPLVARSRWEAAGTDRLNSAHWSKAKGQPINADLSGNLATLRNRSRFEAANNPLVDGVINTHALDWVGPEGPRLEIETADDDFAKRLRQLWLEWFAAPTICGTICGPMLLRQWIRAYWTDGEHIDQLVTDPQAKGITTRIKPIGAERLATPLGKANHKAIALGVERDDRGRPITYHINEQTTHGPFVVGNSRSNPLPAAFVLHDFLAIEADQVRGVPWLATQLQTIADIRDYDAQVLDAARSAADFAVVLTTMHPDAPYFLVDDDIDIERRRITTAPPGYEVSQLRPEQPSTRYVDFRRERLAELGRPVNMPLMLVRLTAENHNFSSARLDMQTYQRGLAAYQNWMGHTLTRLVDLLITEAVLAGLLPLRPADLRLGWGWPKMPHVDPAKEALAERLRLESGTLALQDAATSGGQQVDALIAKRREDAAALADAGLPPVPTATGSLDAAKLLGLLADDDQAAGDGGGDDDQTDDDQAAVAADGRAAHA